MIIAQKESGLKFNIFKIRISNEIGMLACYRHIHIVYIKQHWKYTIQIDKLLDRDLLLTCIKVLSTSKISWVGRFLKMSSNIIKNINVYILQSAVVWHQVAYKGWLYRWSILIREHVLDVSAWFPASFLCISDKIAHDFIKWSHSSDKKNPSICRLPK